MQNKRILAVDPGYERLGIAVLENDKLLFSECFKTKKEDLHHERIKQVGERIQEVIDKYNPEIFAIEELFWGTNQKTALLVAETRGVLLFVASRNKLTVREFKPVEVKIAITGYGRSTKNQIMSMVPKIIKIEKDIKSDDEFDAIAVGITCFQTRIS
ncbi:MAG: crossover junction endodeoxyribonuclease RuvC [Candidatus Pacebacteria bacterium]|nr:crossover junction endodeoxyribonuclease RuvC [Candidatus Paceibacterota bacterium]